jgi:YD repeat-containing protein
MESTRRRWCGRPWYQPAAAETFQYDDRGLLLSASGSAGASSYTYNGAGQMATDTDPAGIQSIVSCVTNPNLASCVRAAVTVAGLALTIATGGAGAVVDAGVDAAADAATDAAADAATDAATDSAADATEDVTDTEGGGGLKETAGDVWNKIQPAGTNRPGLQLGLGAASGGIGNLADGSVSGKRGRTLVEDTAWGAVTGAAGNLGGGTLKLPSSMASRQGSVMRWELT